MHNLDASSRTCTVIRLKLHRGGILPGRALTGTARGPARACRTFRLSAQGQNAKCTRMHHKMLTCRRRFLWLAMSFTLCCGYVLEKLFCSPEFLHHTKNTLQFHMPCQGRFHMRLAMNTEQRHTRSVLVNLSHVCKADLEGKLRLFTCLPYCRALLVERAQLLHTCTQRRHQRMRDPHLLNQNLSFCCTRVNTAMSDWCAYSFSLYSELVTPGLLVKTVE